MKENTFPAQGRARAEVLKELKDLYAHDTNWNKGRTFSLVYHAGEEHTDFLKEVYNLYFHHNGLNPGAFPSLKKFESEVLEMAYQLFHGNQDPQNPAAGTMTSGGSESIMMAIKTYRDFYRAHKPQVTKPEMIVPISIHPAFDKAASYFDVKIVKAQVTADYSVDLAAVEKLINPNTILIVGSAPQYPQGVMDPIESLAKLAIKQGISMHVDACLGGFFLPFAEKNGIKVPPFDFRVPGVTSISADIHKYGFAAKGASVVLYKNKDLRRFQFFVSKEWPGGLFGSPSMTGTRPGGSIAAAWAAVQAFGVDGYCQVAKTVMEITHKMQDGVKSLGFEILGNPIMGVFAFNHKSLDVYAVADQMSLKGWYIDRQQHPICLHLMITPAHENYVEEFMRDLTDSVNFVKAHPETSNQGMAAMYGMAAKAPGAMIDQFLYKYMDDRYEMDAHS